MTARILSQVCWISPTFPLEIDKSHVHIWRSNLEQSELRFQKLSQTLSKQERVRAERYRFEEDKNHFIAGRGILRTILGYYLDVNPGRIEFRYGVFGKPHLTEKFCKDGIQFNLAHSHKLVLYAFTKNRKIGIDLEYFRNIQNFKCMVASFFSEREKKILKALPESQQQEAFFNGWVRKEAYLKAIGSGLTQPLYQFEVSLAAGEAAHLLKAEKDCRIASFWSMKSITPASGYLSALVVEGHNWNPKFYQF